MLRAALMEMAGPIDHEGFRYRGTDVSRLEGLTDGVFALAVTLLVLSAEVPKSYSQLLELIKGLPAFAICFALLMWFWAEHYYYSRRYGLLDRTTITLNSVLIFVVLFYVYPLKMLFTVVTNQLFFGINTDAGGQPFVTDAQWPSLFVLYAIGYASISLVFMIMYLHALRRRAQLELTPVEVVLTHKCVSSTVGRIVVAGASVAAATLLPLRLIPIAGMIYTATGIYEGCLGWYYGRKVGRMQRALAGKA